MNSLREEAESLRDSGYSYNMINQALGVPTSTMSYWFRDRPFKPNQKVLERIKYGPVKSGAIRHRQKLHNISRQHSLGKTEIGKLSKRDLWMFGLGLYVGEGSKSIEAIRVSNSDPFIILATMKWLKEVCGLRDDNFTIRLHIYPDNDEYRAKKYWSSATGLPSKSFRKTIIDARDNKTAKNHKKLPFGTAHLSVVSNGDPTKGVSLFRRIEGWIQGIAHQV